MRYLSLIILLVLSSCSDDDKKFENLELSKILDYEPVLLTSSSQVVYKTSSNEELVFDISVNEFIRERKIDANTYEVEEMAITLTNEDLIYNLYLTITSNYTMDGDPIEFLKGGINLNGHNIMLPSFGLRSDGSPLFCQYSENLVIEGQTYQNVYHNFEQETLDTEYSNVYYSAERGIIAFNDEENKLWVLSEYKE